MADYKNNEKERPAFHVDRELKEAAKRAAEVFEKEERDEREDKYARV